MTINNSNISCALGSLLKEEELSQKEIKIFLEEYFNIGSIKSYKKFNTIKNKVLLTGKNIIDASNFNKKLLETNLSRLSDYITLKEIML